MVFVTSDLHGFPLEKFKSLLKAAGFTNRDYLFVIGDVIDRGEHGGVDILRWMSEQPNVQLLLGNHESLLLAASFIFDEISEQNLAALSQDKLDILSTWIANGASSTLSALRKMMKSEPEVLEGILDMVSDAPLYDCIEVNGQEYVLVHSGIENFDVSRDLSDYSSEELLWARPTIDTSYYSDGRIVIFGHTPTETFGQQYEGKIIKTDSWICIDTGAATGKGPMVLRLDDMQEFYI